jgi:hypothetical protein
MQGDSCGSLLVGENVFLCTNATYAIAVLPASLIKFSRAVLDISLNFYYKKLKTNFYKLL